MSAGARQMVICVLVGVLGFFAALTWRDYRWELSLVTGVAVGLLAFATLRTVERMRDTLRR